MPKTYYDSELTGAQIEGALEAIHGVVAPSNNGKVLYIEDGQIKAASASRWSGGAVLEPLNVIANGDYTPPSGTNGFDSVHVAVPGATLATKSITQNGTYNASQDNADGYSSVTVNVSGGGGAVVQPLSVTQNGTYNPPSGVDGYAPVTVNVSGGGGSIVKIMEQGQVSTTSAYATAYYDSGVDPTQYDILKVDLWKLGSIIGSGIFVPVGSAQQIGGSDGKTYTFATTATSISCTQYSGSYFDLYVDVYGIVLPDAV